MNNWWSIALMLSMLAFGLPLQPKKLAITKNAKVVQHGHLAAFQHDLYILKLPKDMEKSSWLFMGAEGDEDDPSLTPDLTVTLKNGTDVVCSRTEASVMCTISERELTETENLNINVSCIDKCDYTLHIEISDELELELRKPLTLTFSDNEKGQELTLNIPSDEQFDEFVVTAVVENAEGLTLGLELFMNAGLGVKAPTRDSHQWEGVSTWKDGKGIFLKHPYIQPGNTVKLLVLAKGNVLVTVESYVTKNGVRQIGLFQQVRDALPMGSVRHYALDLAEYKSFSETYSIAFRMEKYTGFPEMQLSSSPNFLKDKTMVAIGGLSNHKYLMTPGHRKILDIGDMVYIAISSEYESVFEFIVTLQYHGYIPIQETEPEFSSLQDENVDNILYAYVEPVNTKQTPTPFRINIFLRHQHKIDFHVTRCLSLEANDSVSCLLTKRNEWNVSKSATEIFGDYQNTMGESYFSFNYEASRCTMQNTSDPNVKNRVCVFQIVVMRAPDSPPIIEYEVEVRKQSDIVRMKEGFPIRSRILANEVQKFIFSPVNLEDVNEVRFYITVLSGESFMLVSTDANLDLSTYNGTISNSVSIKKNISSTYYVYIAALEQSFFVLNNHVIRKSKQGQNETFSGMIALEKDIALTFSVSSEEEVMYFGLNTVADYKNITIYVNSISGKVEYQIASTVNGKTMWQFPTEGDRQKMTIVATSEKYVVKVKGVLFPAKFSILYHTSQQRCFLYPLGQPLVISQEPDEPSSSKCIEFHINKAETLEIVMTEPTYIYQNEGANMSYTINGTTTAIKKRFTKIDHTSMKMMCKGLLNNLRRSDQQSCHLRLNISKVPQDHTFTLVVQYTNKEMILFDGMLQRVKGLMSESQGRFFIYEPTNNNSISVFLRPKTKGGYRMLATFVENVNLKSINRTKLFPIFEQTSNENLFISDTTDSGMNMLSISSTNISDRKCKSCVLLLSVFVRGSEMEADFKIEVTQSPSIISSDQNRFGYVETDVSLEYHTTITEETVISINTFHQNCAKLDVLALNEKQNKWQSLPHNQGDIFFIANKPKDADSASYLIVVTGLDDCSFQLTLSPTSYQLYELHEGVPHDLILDAGDNVYFLYFHSEPESFRLLSLSEYGDVRLSGESLNASELSTLDTVKKTKREFSFDESYGSLRVDSRNQAFCSDCYYLLRVNAINKANTSILLHTNSSAVWLRSNMVIKESLDRGQDEDYMFNSVDQFNLTIDVLYGTATVSIMRASNREEIIQQRQITNKTILTIKPNASEKSITQVNPARTYIISVSCEVSDTVGYSIGVSGGEGLHKLRKGIPTNLQITRSQTCLQFPSFTGEEGLSIMIDSVEPISNLNYALDFVPDDDESDLIEVMPELTRSDYSLLMRLHSVQGVFKLCMQALLVSTEVSVQLLGSEIPIHLQINKEVLFESASNKASQIFEVYTPVRGYLMFEGFDCRGEINVFGSENLDKLDSRKSELRFQHTKLFGHYVATVKVDSGLFFLAADNRKSSEYTDSLSILRYSQYKPGMQPYEWFDMDGGDSVSSRIDSLEDIKGVGITLRVNKINQLEGGKFNVLNHYYRFYISGSQLLLKEASQCNAAVILNKTIGFGANLERTPNVVEAHFTADDINRLELQNGTMFFTAVCYVELAPIEKYNTDLLKFVYSNSQLTLRQKIVRTYTKLDFALWFVLPGIVGLIVLLCALRFCVRRVYMGTTELVEEKDDQHGELQQKQRVSGLDTNNILATGSMDNSRGETGMITQGKSTTVTPPPELAPKN